LPDSIGDRRVWNLLGTDPLFEYDKAGNRTKRADDAVSPSKTLKYSYDNIYEVTEVYHVQGPEAVEKSEGI